MKLKNLEKGRCRSIKGSLSLVKKLLFYLRRDISRFDDKLVYSSYTYSLRCSTYVDVYELAMKFSIVPFRKFLTTQKKYKKVPFMVSLT